MQKNLLLLLLSTVLFLSCEDTLTTPKPRAYPRVVYPKKEYQPFDANYCNFTFDQAAYAKIEKDTSFFGEKPKNECWFNLDVQQLNAKIHCSYSAIHSRAEFDELVKDAFNMANKHNIKANYIEEIPIHREKDRVHGVFFSLEGSAASTCQFFLTDSTHHFLRGALYFNTQTKPDSLAPVIAFMKADVNRLVETLKWR